MSEHETIRELLALAASGSLEADELQRVRRHAQGCDACRRDLDVWTLCVEGLRRLPQPETPMDLLERTRARILEEHAAADARRWNGLLLGALSLFGWGVSVGGWVLAESWIGGVLEVPAGRFVGVLTWFSVSTVLTWVTAGTAAVMLGHRRARRGYERAS